MDTTRRQSGSAGAGRADAGLVHAPGRPVAARVPRDPQAPQPVRGLPTAGALRRGHARAGAPARRRRGRDVRRHHAPGARHGRRRPARRERRAGDRAAHPDGRRRRGAARSRPRGGGSLHPRGGPACPGRARARAGARRLLRRAVHRRGLPRGGSADAGFRPDQAPHVRRPRDLARPDGEADGDVDPLPPREGRGGRRCRPALRLLDRSALARRLRGVRVSVLAADPRLDLGADDPLRNRHAAPARAR